MMYIICVILFILAILFIFLAGVGLGARLEERYHDKS